MPQSEEYKEAFLALYAAVDAFLDMLDDDGLGYLGDNLHEAVDEITEEFDV